MFTEATEIGNVSVGGLIIAEKRGPTLDHELDLAWLNLKIQGTRYMQASAIEKRILALNLREKSSNRERCSRHAPLRRS